MVKTLASYPNLWSALHLREVKQSTLLTFWTYIRHSAQSSVSLANTWYTAGMQQLAQVRDRDVVSRLQLSQRGCRTGHKHRRHVLAAQFARSSVSWLSKAGEILTIIGNSRLSDVHIVQLFHSDHDARVTTAKKVLCRSCRAVIQLGLFNVDHRHKAEPRRPGRNVCWNLSWLL